MSIPAQGAVGAETMTAGPKMVLLPMDDPSQPLHHSGLPSAMIRAGGDAFHRLKRDHSLVADSCSLAVGIYRAMTEAHAKEIATLTPPAALASPRADSDERTAGEPQGAWMQTFCLPHFRVLDPDPSQILIEDIAHHLSQNVRYGGACIRFLSVAEHSVHMARAARPEHALWALLHDASETYLHDLVRPVKRSLAGYAQAEDRIMRAVCERFGLPLEMPREVERASTT